MSKEPVAYSKTNQVVYINMDVTNAPALTVRYGKRKFVPDHVQLGFHRPDPRESWEPCRVEVDGQMLKADGTLGITRYDNSYHEWDVDEGRVPAWLMDIVDIELAKL
jgi:hypothetical protein